jgi:hypothetical protein
MSDDMASNGLTIMSEGSSGTWQRKKIRMGILKIMSEVLLALCNGRKLKWGY